MSRESGCTSGVLVVVLALSVPENLVLFLQKVYIHLARLRMVEEQIGALLKSLVDGMAQVGDQTFILKVGVSS